MIYLLLASYFSGFTIFSRPSNSVLSKVLYTTEITVNFTKKYPVQVGFLSDVMDTDSKKD